MKSVIISPVYEDGVKAEFGSNFKKAANCFNPFSLGIERTY